MPELPEVETVKRGLAKLITGRTVKSVEYTWQKSFPNDAAEVNKHLIGAKITDVRRRAKVLIIDLSSVYSLVIHLKMTGQLVFVAENQQRTEIREKRNEKETRNSILNSRFSTDGVRFGGGHPSDSLVGKLPDKSTRVEIAFTDGSKLFFNDQRKFGWVKIIESQKVQSLKFIKELGPEPLEPDFTEKIFIERISKHPNALIKAVLLDQTVLAGVGNIYADESLWAAKIHPSTRVKNVPKTKLRILHDELLNVLNLSIEKGGSTDKNYVDAEGKRGSYLKFAKVFRKEGQACPRHTGVLIEKIKVAGRGTHICSVCQKL